MSGVKGELGEVVDVEHMTLKTPGVAPAGAVRMTINNRTYLTIAVLSTHAAAKLAAQLVAEAVAAEYASGGDGLAWLKRYTDTIATTIVGDQ